MLCKILLALIALPGIIGVDVNLLIDEPSSSGSVDYEDWSSAYVSQFWVSGCTKQPCGFTKGQPYTVKLSGIFQSANTTSLPFTVTAWKFGFISFQLLSGDGCAFLTKGKCPLKFGDPFDFEVNMTPPISLPSVSVLIEAQLKDDTGNMIICGDLNVQVD